MKIHQPEVAARRAGVGELPRARAGRRRLSCVKIV
jgi:hypothetical protein